MQNNNETKKKTIIKVSDILSHAYFLLLAFKLPVSLLFVVSIVSRDGTWLFFAMRVALPS
jgi:hypothetical protein